MSGSPAQRGAGGRSGTPSKRVNGKICVYHEHQCIPTIRISLGQKKAPLWSILFRIAYTLASTTTIKYKQERTVREANPANSESVIGGTKDAACSSTLTPLDSGGFLNSLHRPLTLLPIQPSLLQWLFPQRRASVNRTLRFPVRTNLTITARAHLGAQTT